MESKTLGMLAIIFAIISLIIAGAAVMTPGPEGPKGSVGTTGLFYVNADKSGELISKNKALLFSMIF
jgi:hypothetical protein